MSDSILPDEILQPIAEDHPAGAPLRDEEKGAPELYFSVRDDANVSRTAERKLFAFDPERNEEADRPEPPKWERVLEQSIDLLSNKSKDLWVAAWMIEALCRVHGFRGLRDGFRMTRQLCEQYWDQLYGGGEEQDYYDLVSQLAGLNGEEGDGTLIDPIRRIPITASPERYSFFDFLTATHLDADDDPERRQKRIDLGQITLEQFEAAAAASSNDFYAELMEDIKAALSEFDALTDVLVARCKVVDEEDGSETNYAPPSTNIRRAIEEVRDRVSRNSGQGEGDAADGASDVEGGAADEASGSAASGQVTTGPIKSRDDAFRQILTIASYFEQAEPHSPVSYGLRQVVRWGRLSLPDLLSTLIDSRDVREQLFRHIGIDEPAESEES